MLLRDLFVGAYDLSKQLVPSMYKKGCEPVPQRLHCHHQKLQWDEGLDYRLRDRGGLEEFDSCHGAEQIMTSM